MLNRVVRSMKVQGSEKRYFQQRIPKDLIEKARGKSLAIPLGDHTKFLTISPKAIHVRFSLGTADPSEAKIRQAQAAAYLETFWQTLRQGPQNLSHKQTVALSGEIYRSIVEALEDNPGDAQTWEKVKGLNEQAQRGQLGITSLRLISAEEKIALNLEERFGPFADVALSKRGLSIDSDTRVRLLKQVAKAMDEATDKVLQFAEGDYDTSAPRTYPSWEEAEPKAKQSTVSMLKLVEGWWIEAKAAGRSISTMEGYKATFRKFAEFMKHDDATKVTPEDVIAFKDFRLQHVSAKTVNDADLAGMRAVFNWAVKNKKMDSNPAQGISIKVGKKTRNRPSYFRTDEIKAILEASRSYRKTSKQEHDKTAFAKRWISWVCAYGGARIGEIAQLRKKDIRQEDGYWIINITPEAGTVKTKEARELPIHEHLISEGFLEFVSQQSEGYLFLNAGPEDDIRGKWRTCKNRVTEFIRKVVPDPEVQPNHGWRHTFKTICRETPGIDSYISDCITGHAHTSEGDKYGGGTLKAKVN